MIKQKVYCYCIVLLCMSMFLVTACTKKQETNRGIDKIPVDSYTIEDVQFPFDTNKLKYAASMLHDDFLDIFMWEDDNLLWYIYDMNTETWEEKDLFWHKQMTGRKYSFYGGLNYDSKGNLYGIWKKIKDKNDAPDIYKMNNDGTLELYVKFSDYVPDYEGIEFGWKFLEDDRILATVEYENGIKNIIIDPIQKKLQETYIDDIFEYRNIVVDENLYVYPTENDYKELCFQVGAVWENSNKMLIQSGIELDYDTDSFGMYLPLLREEDNYYSITRYGIYAFTLQNKKMRCVVPAEVIQKKLSECRVYDQGYKAEGENKFFVLGDGENGIHLYKIE